MKRALLIATVSGFIPQFEYNNVKILQQSGYEVHYASNFHNVFYENTTKKISGMNMICHQIDFERSPFNIVKNVLAYKQLKALVHNETFDLVHCHTPMGGVIGRIVFRKHTGCCIYYTAHGFHFYKGAPLKNWLIYYPVEYWLARYTDVLITINQEDYKNARKFRAKKVVYVPGVGINTTVDNSIDIKNKRAELEIPENAFLMLSVGELNRNKNHEIIIKAMAEIKNEELHYIICGQGKNFNKLQNLIQTLGLKERVKLLGFRSDINEIYPCADVFVHPSYREGLSAALMEAMSYGLPCIASAIRGNRDLIDDKIGGYIIKPNDKKGFAEAILRTVNNKTSEFGKHNRKKIQNYSKEKVTKIMCGIYSDGLTQNFTKNV